MQAMQDDANTEPSPLGDNPGYQPRQLVLLGAGHAHLQFLARIPRQPLVGPRITLIAPHGRHLMPSHIAGFVAGRHRLEDCTVDLEPLVRRSGIRWLTRSVRGLDVTKRSVLLDDLSTLQFDWLSINTGAVQNRALLDQTIPGIREHGLFLRPMESFCTLWPQVASMGDERALRIAVIGAGLAGAEISMAIKQRLPRAAVALLGDNAAGSGLGAPMQRRLQEQLRAAGITCIQARVGAVAQHEITLENGTRMACDIPVVATGSQAPYWLQQSGLDLDEQGYVVTQDTLCSTSHPNVFAAGDVRARHPGEAARNLAQASRDAQALISNLYATVAGKPAHARARRSTGWQWMDSGTGQALVGRGALWASGLLARWLKRWRDVRLLAHFRAH